MFMVHGWLMFIQDWRVRWMMMHESCIRLLCHAWDSAMAIWHKVSPRRSDKVAHKASDIWLFHVFVEMTWILNLLLSEGHARHVEICQCWNIESLETMLITRWDRTKQWKKMKVYHESMNLGMFVPGQRRTFISAKKRHKWLEIHSLIKPNKIHWISWLFFVHSIFFKMIYVEHIA